MTLKEILKKDLTAEELKILPSSFDIIGNKDKAVAIISIPAELEEKESTIAHAVMKKHKNVKSVLAKGSPVKGIYRIRDYRLILGDKNTEVVHSENGCRYLVDPKKVYFSPRESTERARIVSEIKEGEVVLVFFAGIGPFAIQIAKKAKPSKVIGIEINPEAVNYFLKNAALNKVKIEVILGDVKDSIESLKGIADRVIMPLPETSIDYVKEAIYCLRKDGIVNFYCFSEEQKIVDFQNRIKEVSDKKIIFTGTRKVLPWGPGIWKMRIDFTFVS